MLHYALMATQVRMEKIAKMLALRQQDVTVVVEDIYDPHNAAAVFRSCDAFGIPQVHLIFERQDRFNPKKVGKKTSSSGNKWLDFQTYSSTAECIRSLKEAGYSIVSTALTPDSVSVFETDFTDYGKIALCFGNEHRGLSPALLELSDLVIKIPMRGMVQSLNLSVSAGIFLYEVTRQRMAS